MFDNKSIFIVSPQSWGSRPTSKRHYAEELSKKYRVYFLNPPKLRLGSFTSTMDEVSDNLNVIDITLGVPLWTKFKIKGLYDFLCRRSIHKVLKQLPEIDYLWNFDNGTYFTYEELFKNAIKIFHPVDDFFVNLNYEKYDFGFSVSNDIAAKIPLKRKMVINHGVQGIAFRKGENDLKIDLRIKASLIATYVGNLSIPFLDVVTLQKVIISLTDVKFRFIGDYNQETKFISFLRNQKNVELLGKKVGLDMFELLGQSDILFLCYKKQKGYYADNSHKVLEYLSTGKVIVSSALSMYKGSDLLLMASENNSDYLKVFNYGIRHYEELNSTENQSKRRTFALDNTYAQQLVRIEKFCGMNNNE